jgi:hypothetical protein
MNGVALDHIPAGHGGHFSVGGWERRNPTNGRQDRSTAIGWGACGWLYWRFLSTPARALLALSAISRAISRLQAPPPQTFPRRCRDGNARRRTAGSARPYPVSNRGAKRARTVVGEATWAAKKAGHTGETFNGAGARKRLSTCGRTRRAGVSPSSRSPGWRVTIMTQIVRHQGQAVSSAVELDAFALAVAASSRATSAGISFTVLTGDGSGDCFMP